MSRKSVSAFLMVVLVLASVIFLFDLGTAEAVPTLRFSDGTTIVEVWDGREGYDLRPEENIVAYTGQVGSLEVDVTGVGTNIGTMTDPRLTLSAAVVGEGTMTIWFSETGFGPTEGSFLTFAGGTTTGDSVMYGSFSDTSNDLYGEGITLGDIGSISGSDSSGMLSLENAYSLTAKAIITHTSPGDITSFGLNIDVPETSSLLYVTICIGGIYSIRRKMLNNADMNAKNNEALI